MPVRVVENPAGMRALLTGQDGGIRRDLLRRGIRVQNAAKLNATGRSVTGARNPEGRGPRVRSNRLRSSIGVEIREEADGFAVRVGTNVEYALPLETGLRNGATYPFLGPALAFARDG